jgi:hypothetical protein
VITQAAVLSRLLMVIVLIGAGFLLLGLMTPIIAVAIGLSSFVVAVSSYEVVEMVVLTLVIALLGPGAFSIDARMFGRREVLIPRRANEAPAARDCLDR